jgi:NACHT domain/Restriction endonuclease
MLKKSLLSKSPLHSWEQFEQFIHEILDIGGFKHQGNIKIQGRQTDIWCTITNPLIFARVLVECKSTKSNSSLPLSHVTEFCSRLALARTSGIADLGWIITNHSISDNAWSIIKDAHLEGACNILQPQELLSKLLDLPSYLSQAGLNLPRSETGYVDSFVKVTTELGKHYNKKDTFFGLFEKWLDDSGRPLLLLLGDYGQGKTTCCEEIIRRFKDNGELLFGRIPLYIRLRDVANQGYNLSSMLRVCLQEQFGLDYHSFGLLQLLAKRGTFLFIFDGLDEITYTLRWTEVYEAFKQITGIIYPKNKVLVTSRPGAFPSGQNIINSLDSLAKLFPDNPNPNFTRVNFLVANLEYFNEKQVREAIANFGIKDTDKVIDLMGDVHDLTDLSRRPITLKMILESLDQLQDKDIHTPADLYRNYTSKWLARDGWRSNIESISLEYGRDLKQEFLENLAWSMYQKNVLFVDTAFIEECIKNHCGNFIDLSDTIRAFSKEVAVCSFLDTRPNGTLSFSHKSFFEYFVARYLASLEPEELGNFLSSNVLDYEVLAFLCHIVDWQKSIANNLNNIEQNRVLAANFLHASAISGFPIVCHVKLLKDSVVRCKSTNIINIVLADSDPRLVGLASNNLIDITLARCNIGNIELESKYNVHAEFKETIVANIKVVVEGVLTLNLASSCINGGSVEMYEKCELVIDGNVSLSGVIFDSFNNISVILNGNLLTAIDRKNTLKGMGAISKTIIK